MKVLVLRARDDAARTAAKLAACGAEALCAPLTTVRPTGAAPPAGEPDAYLITSAKAVPALAALPEVLRRRPVLAVGARSARAARDAGLPDVREADGDAVSLARLAARTVAPGARLIHAAGRDRKPEPRRSLEAAGFVVEPWITYEAVAETTLPEVARAAILSGDLDAVLHYSARGAALLLGLAREAGCLEPLLALRHGALSADAAAPLREAGARRIETATEPNEEAMFGVLGLEPFPRPSP